MWCTNCKSEVAAEVALDNRRVRCATCSTELSIATEFESTTTSTDFESTTKDARELLERWSKGPLVEPFGPMSGAVQPVTAESSEPLAPETPDRESQATPKFRVDAPHRPTEQSEFSDQPQSEPAVSESAASAPPQQEDLVSTPRVHLGHEFSTPPPPHFAAQTTIDAGKTRTTNSSAFWGQVMAYCGVLALTVGTSLVLWSYFGGPESYAPTGWLISTAGQMLLFLGVITLVSGGLEQTTDEVARRVETIGKHILRIEQASKDHALRGPSIPAERFADQPHASAASSRQQAVQSD